MHICVQCSIKTIDIAASGMWFSAKDVFCIIRSYTLEHFGGYISIN